MSPNVQLALGIAAGLFMLPLLAFVARTLTVEVDDEESALVTRFGKLARVLNRPGLHLLPSRLLPWVKVQRVSRARDFRHFVNVHVNDSRGTTVMIDLFLEFRIVDPVKAMFSVADWDRSLQNLVAHAATSILGNREFQQILHHRLELGELLQHDIAVETGRWGLQIELAMISKVSLLPEVSRQIFESVAARLERARASIEETGRLEIAKLEAETSVQVARLVAEAKGQYPAAIGRALDALAATPEVRAAYMELYELAQIRPHRTVAFRGFAEGALRAADAAMLATPAPQPAAPLPTNGVTDGAKPQA